MLAGNIIEPAQTEWAAPFVFVPEQDGTLRFRGDYRKLNALTTRDSYTILCMNECIDSVVKRNVFSKLNANSGYWQIKIKVADKDKNAFTMQHSVHRFIRMPFGSKKAPGTFKHTMYVILSASNGNLHLFTWKALLFSAWHQNNISMIFAKSICF